MMNKEEKLASAIIRHKMLYYQGRPEISDSEYDRMEEELQALNPDNYVLRMVGGLSHFGERIKHKKKMLSLAKTYDLEDLKNWMGDKEVVSSLKVDGVSCSLIYQKGELTVAKTRGDGTYGEDILSKVLWISSIPKKIPQAKELEVRGEIYCAEKEFVLLSQEMISRGLERPTSPRNIVAGLMGRKDNIDICRYLNFFAFELLSEEDHFTTEWEKSQKLGRLNFVLPGVHLHKEGKDGKEIENVLQEAKKQMSKGNFQIDGVVFSFNDPHVQEELGETSHHPRYKMAFKFPGEVKRTTIEEIRWKVSRNGVLTPVAKVAPVELSGALISRVTLHNYGMVALYKLKKGDTIEILRSGEVIPKFISLIKESQEPLLIPKNCPNCGSKLLIETIRLICPNLYCSGRNKEGILNFIQKIGIEEISSKRLEEMIKKDLVKAIPDLYRITVDDFLTLEKVKEKLAKKLFDSIQKTKKVDIKTFLAAIGIRGGAYNKCAKVVDAGFDTLKKVKALTLDQVKSIDSFADKSAKDFLESLQSKFPLIDELVALGFEVKSARSSTGNGLQGKKFCLTGTLSVSRSVIEEKIREEGGLVQSSVSEGTHYLITNDRESSSAKFVKAKKYGIPILSENDFENLLKNARKMK